MIDRRDDSSVVDRLSATRRRDNATHVGCSSAYRYVTVIGGLPVKYSPVRAPGL